MFVIYLDQAFKTGAYLDASQCLVVLVFEGSECPPAETAHVSKYGPTGFDIQHTCLSPTARLPPLDAYSGDLVAGRGRPGVLNPEPDHRRGAGGGTIA